MNVEEAKRRAGISAANLIEDGEVVGLGTGSTAAYAVEEIGRRVREEGLETVGIPTSHGTRRLALDNDVPLTSLDVETPDVAVDGADQFDASLNLIKGGGAAHAREKVVAESADRFVVVVDETKRSDALDASVPVEVPEFAASVVEERLEELGAEAEVREAERKDGPVVTDNGNLVVDADFGTLDDPEGLGREVASLPAVVEHGIFVGIVDEVHVGTSDGVTIEGS
ncbi:MAG: ribose 5-phosphate isomerase A [Halobacteria archaeon]|nr:ribose 5-phosphate isomerase A [Halobacteria archaeon]